MQNVYEMYGSGRAMNFYSITQTEQEKCFLSGQDYGGNRLSVAFHSKSRIDLLFLIHPDEINLYPIIQLMVRRMSIG